MRWDHAGLVAALGARLADFGPRLLLGELGLVRVRLRLRVRVRVRVGVRVRVRVRLTQTLTLTR